MVVWVVCSVGRVVWVRLRLWRCIEECLCDHVLVLVQCVFAKQTQHKHTATHTSATCNTLTARANAPASSSASHAPTQLGGCVHRNVESWWGTTSPPIRGCLKMYLF